MEVHGFCQGADTLLWSSCLRVESLQGWEGMGLKLTAFLSPVQHDYGPGEDRRLAD